MLRPGTGTLMRDTESQGQVRNYQVLTHLSGGPNMCPALAAQPPLFPASFHSLVFLPSRQFCEPPDLHPVHSFWGESGMAGCCYLKLKIFIYGTY